MRIVSLSPSITEILFALGVGDQIVADTYFCDFPEEAKKIAKAGDFSNIKIDKIRSFNPDVVFTSTVVQEKFKENLNKEKFSHLHFDPRSLADIYDDILKLGDNVGKQKIALGIVNKMQTQEKSLKKRRVKRKLRVYIEEWFDPPMVSGNWVPDIVKTAGGKYFSLKNRSMSIVTDFKKLKSFDPEVIFVSYCGYGKRSDADLVYQRDGWQSFSALKNKNVIPVDETYLNRPGPRILHAAEEIYRLLTNIVN